MMGRDDRVEVHERPPDWGKPSRYGINLAAPELAVTFQEPGRHLGAFRRRVKLHGGLAQDARNVNPEHILALVLNAGRHGPAPRL